MPRTSLAVLIDDETMQRAIETRFECARCGHCCKGDGLVKIGAAEADRMAAALGLSRAEFVKLYAVRTGRERWRLKDRFEPVVTPPGAAKRPPEQWCIFLERGEDGLYGCRVNAVKPDQCGSFPARWRNADSLKTCVGLRHLQMLLTREGPDSLEK